jgi:NodT family efflux transporter outer membrane factor (OMF) lipoprotein
MRKSVCVAVLLAHTVALWSQQLQKDSIKTPLYSLPADHGLVSDSVDTEWWQQFHDQELETLILRATRENVDLHAAVARVEQARSNVYVARADGLPQINTSAEAGRNRSQELAVQSSTSYEIVPVELNNFEGGLNLSWEIDVFGRVRNEVKAARFDALAANENRRNVLVALLGDVGRYYADLRGTQLRLDIARKNIEIERDIVGLTKSRTAAGLGTEFDVKQAQAQLDSVEAAVPPLEYTLRADIHRLSVLTGREPDELTSELLGSQPLPALPPVIPVGLPSELLKRRPDIRSADAQLQAQMARIGQAKADYFPRFLLTGSADRQSTQIRYLTLGASNIYSIGPTIELPVFQGGRIRANVALQKSRAAELASSYRSTVLNALEETQNAIENYCREQDRHRALDGSDKDQKAALELAQVQYRAGLTTFLPVLDAERQLYSIQDQLAVSSLTLVVDTVTIYRALGGGWNVPGVQP